MDLSQETLSRLLENLSQRDRATYDSLSESEREVFVRAVAEMTASGDKPTIDALYAMDYDRTPVGPDTFFTDPYYVGKYTAPEPGKGLYPVWRKELRFVLTNPNIYELALTGAIGSGKTTCAIAALAYKLYCLSCLRDPQSFYGLIPGSLIVFGLFSLFKYKVANTSWHLLNEMVRNSPYFRDHFKPDPEKTKDLVFPKNVSVLAGATELQAIGENLFSVLIDEADFMKESTTASQRGQAAELHQAVRRRVESRFGQRGRMPPGLIILVSSKKTTESYIEKYVDANRKDPVVHVCDYSLWDVKPDRYPAARFKVWLGFGMQEGRVLGPEEEAPQVGRVIEVPDAPALRRAFTENAVAAARDLSGVSSESAYRFLSSQSPILSSIDPNRAHPFEGEHVILDYQTKDAVEDFLVHTALLRIDGSRYKPLVHPDAPRFIHVDIGVSRDSAGIAVAHAGEAVAVARFNKDGSQYQALAPSIYVDLMLRVKPPRGSQIDLGKIRQFIAMLAEYGFPIKGISYDGYQSTDSIQILRKQGFSAALLSVDKKPDPYYSLRQAAIEGRLKMYRYVPFLDEIFNLTEDPKNGKIDHPRTMRSLVSGELVTGSKDVADAVAACCHHIMEDESLLVAPATENERRPAPRTSWTPVDPNDHSWVIDRKVGDNRIVGIR